MDNDDDYGVSLTYDELFQKRNDGKFSNLSSDISALLYFISKNYNLEDFVREIQIMAPIEDVDEIANMLQRGYTELKEFINAKVDDRIKGLLIDSRNS